MIKIMIMEISLLGIQTESAWLGFAVYHKPKNKQGIVYLSRKNIWKDYESKLTFIMDAFRYNDCIHYNILLLLLNLPCYSQFWHQLVTVNDFEKWWS
jgi:hypothetical protein